MPTLCALGEWLRGWSIVEHSRRLSLQPSMARNVWAMEPGMISSLAAHLKRRLMQPTQSCRTI
jgi:hypothetical protein